MNYSEFTSILGEDNITFLNKENAYLICGIGGYINDYFGELSFGINRSEDYDNDSIIAEIITSRFGISLGLNRINTKHISIRPTIGIDLFRRRLPKITILKQNFSD